jgi:hypothetical protein
MNVAVQSQPKTNKSVAASKATGPKKTPPQANKKTKDTDRKKAETLAGTVGKTLESATGAVVGAGADVAKESIKGGLTSAVINFVGPIRFMIMSNPIGHMAARPLVKYLAPKLENYLEANKIDLPVKPSAILNQVLFGDLEDIDGEVSKALDGFIEKALPNDVKKAFESGNLMNIAKVTGVSIGSGAKGLMSQIFNMPNSNKFTSFFKFIGQKTPLLNKLSPKFQPWAAGAGVFMFGGLIVRLVVKATKLLVGGTLLATGGVFAKKIYDKISKSQSGAMGASKKAPGAMGGAMNALAGLAGGGKPGGGMMDALAGAGGAPSGGMGNMMNAAQGLMGMLGKK